MIALTPAKLMGMLALDRLSNCLPRGTLSGGAAGCLCIWLSAARVPRICDLIGTRPDSLMNQYASSDSLKPIAIQVYSDKALMAP